MSNDVGLKLGSALLAAHPELAAVILEPEDVSMIFEMVAAVREIEDPSIRPMMVLPNANRPEGM